MDKGKIVFLNGPSSSGKTTLAEALQHRFSNPFYILSIDTFYKMLNREKYFDGTSNNQDKTIKIMNKTVKLFSDNGYNVILDRIIPDTLRGSELMYDLSDTLLENPVLYVRVECPLFELERREKFRQDRNIGQAKQRYLSMQEGKIFNIKVDTYYMSIDQCIDEMVSVMFNPNEWKAFLEIRKIYNQTKKYNRRQNRAGEE